MCFSGFAKGNSRNQTKIPILTQAPCRAVKITFYGRLDQRGRNARPRTTSQTFDREKAFRVNLDHSRYGTFAEIGAGQEVARWFFKVGGAAGTVAKTMSAYDMKVSDAIYGKCKRYVSRERLESMLDHEHRLNIERLKVERGDNTAFFVFADTVAARNYKGTNECHGWMGVRFQAPPA